MDYPYPKQKNVPARPFRAWVFKGVIKVSSESKREEEEKISVVSSGQFPPWEQYTSKQKKTLMWPEIQQAAHLLTAFLGPSSIPPFLLLALEAAAAAAEEESSGYLDKYDKKNPRPGAIRARARAKNSD